MPDQRPEAQAIAEVRHALLHLHKVLLESERQRYEKVRGKIESSGKLLQLVLNDPWFAWLRQLSELVVQIDEALDAKEPVPVGDLKALREQVRGLLQPSESGEGFSREYFRSLQDVPAAVLAHRDVIRLLKAGPNPQIH